MFKNIAENLIDNIKFLVGTASFIVLALQNFKKLICYCKEKRYIKETLMFKNKKCFISCSVYKKEHTDAKWDFVIAEAMQCFQKLQEFLHDNGFRVLPYSDDVTRKNIIYLGGPAANINVNSLFVSNFQRFKCFMSEQNKEWHEKLGLNTSCICYSNDINNHQLYYKIGDTKLQLDAYTDYAIFIRIPNSPKDGIEYTTHVIFCGWANDTTDAIDFFINNYKMIAKKYKRKKYCFAVKMSRINNKIVQQDRNSIIDLTNQLFN